MKKTKHLNGKRGTRDLILKSAEKLFAQKGFELTTVREIAENSGANIAMIYYYFKTKEGLHKEILEESFRNLSLSLKEGLDRNKESEEKIYDIIRIYITFLHTHKNLHRIILRETVSRSGHIEMIVKRYISKNFNIVHNVIREGVQQGFFRKQDTALSTFSLIGMILYYFTYEPIFTRLISPEKRKKPITEYLPDHIFDLFMEGVRK